MPLNYFAQPIMTSSNRNSSMALCARNSPVAGEFPTQRPLTQSVDVCPLVNNYWPLSLLPVFSKILKNMSLSKQLSKQSGRRSFGTPSRPLWRHCNDCYHIPLHVRHIFLQIFVSSFFYSNSPMKNVSLYITQCIQELWEIRLTNIGIRAWINIYIHTK